MISPIVSIGGSQGDGTAAALASGRHKGGHPATIAYLVVEVGAADRVGGRTATATSDWLAFPDQAAEFVVAVVDLPGLPIDILIDDY